MRRSTAIVFALLVTLGACGDGQDDGDAETFVSYSGPGDGEPGDGDGEGDGDGDPSSGDGDGDGDTLEGDGDGEPTTGDGDGDGDTPGACPDGTSYIHIDALFYNADYMLEPMVLEECVSLYAWPEDGFLLTYTLPDSVFQIAMVSPSMGVHQLEGGSTEIAVSLNMQDGVPPGWLSLYSQSAGTIELVGYLGVHGGHVEFQVDATLVKEEWSVDISAHGLAEFQ